MRAAFPRRGAPPVSPTGSWTGGRVRPGQTEISGDEVRSHLTLTVLPRLANRAAAELFLTGDTFAAGRAAEVGLISRAVDSSDDVDAAVAEFIASFAACSPQGLRESKSLLNHHVLAGFAADRDRLADQSSRLFASEEAREGMAAFLERRPPRWAT